MKNQKNIEPKDFLEILSADLAREQENNRIHKAIRKVLDKWDGKKINRRIVEQIKKEAFPGDENVIVHYSDEYGQLYIRIWGGSTGVHYDNRMSFFIGYWNNHGDPRCLQAYKAEAFEDTDGCNGKWAEERNAQRQAILDNPHKLYPLVSAVNAARDAWATLQDELKGDSEVAQMLQYKALDMTGLKEDRNR